MMMIMMMMMMTGQVRNTYMKVIGSRLRSQEQKSAKFSIPASILMGSKSGSRRQRSEVCVQHGVFGYGRSNGVTAVFVT